MAGVYLSSTIADLKYAARGGRCGRAHDVLAALLPLRERVQGADDRATLASGHSLAAGRHLGPEPAGGLLAGEQQGQGTGSAARNGSSRSSPGGRGGLHMRCGM